MEKQQKKEMNRAYTQFSGGEIRMEAYPVQVVLHHLPEGLLSSSVFALDQKQIWSCEHTGKQSLSTYCAQKELGSEDFQWIYGGVLHNLKEIQEFLLDVNGLFLDPEEIYLDSMEHKVWNCFVPFYEKDIWQSLLELSQYLLGYLDQSDPDAVRIAYGMFRYFVQGGCNLEEAWGILCEKTVDPKEERHEPRETSDFIEEIQKEDDSKRTKIRRFPVVGWMVIGLSWSAAIFLFVYITFNEWYISDTGKISMLILAAALGFLGMIAWKRWSPGMKKKNPMNEERDELRDLNIVPVRLVRMDTGDTIVVSQNPSVIGKLPERIQIQIQESTVSRIHAKLFCVQGGYYLEDLNSKNGTYVNGKRLESQKPVRLKEGDELVFANIHYYFRL